MKLRAGDTVTHRELSTLSGPVPIPDPARLIHLQFRRYAGCPICNLHLRDYAARQDELVAADIREVVVFHSTADDLRQHQANLPFDVVPDPTKNLYGEFGVERRLRSVLHLSAVLAIVRGWSPSQGLQAGPGGHLGLPADFLIDHGGKILTLKYGTHANDQWSVDEVVALARQHGGG